MSVPPCSSKLQGSCERRNSKQVIDPGIRPGHDGHQSAPSYYLSRKAPPRCAPCDASPRTGDGARSPRGAAWRHSSGSVLPGRARPGDAVFCGHHWDRCNARTGPFRSCVPPWSNPAFEARRLAQRAGSWITAPKPPSIKSSPQASRKSAMARSPVQWLGATFWAPSALRPAVCRSSRFPGAPDAHRCVPGLGAETARLFPAVDGPDGSDGGAVDAVMGADRRRKPEPCDSSGAIRRAFLARQLVSSSDSFDIESGCLPENRNPSAPADTNPRTIRPER